MMIDVMFSSALELGRLGTRSDIHPLRVELSQRIASRKVYESYYGCRVRFNAPHDLLVFSSIDLDRTFVTYNHELLQMLGPQLDQEFSRKKGNHSVSEKVKWIMERSMERGDVNIQDIARELGIGNRTLQRRIANEGTTFRRLFDETRHQLARRYLEDCPTTLKDVAFLLEYEDTTSFFRAFNRWEGQTPSVWRAHAVRNRSG